MGRISKNKNRFQFVSFNERVRKIRVNTRKYILKKLESESEIDTLLWQNVQECRSLNLTTHFWNFVSALGSDYRTVTQLILNEERVADTIRRFLVSGDILSRPSILQCLVSFARDLPQHFYEHQFYSFVEVLVTIVTENSQSSETIEEVFLTFVSLFTLLQKYIVKDFFQFFVKGDLLSLLGARHPWFINELTAQAVGALVRKVMYATKKEALFLCLRRLSRRPEEAVGVGRLLFHALKSDVTRRLHSTAAQTLEVSLELIVTSEDVPTEEAVTAVVFALKQLANHVVGSQGAPGNWSEIWKQESRHVWPLLLERLVEGPEEDAIFRGLLRMISVLVEFRHGLLVIDFDVLLEALAKAVRKDCRSEDALSLLGEVAASLATSAYFRDAHEPALTRFLSAFLHAPGLPMRVAFREVELLSKAASFDRVALPFSLQFALDALDRESNRAEVLGTLTAIVVAKVEPVRGAVDLSSWAPYEIDFTALPEVASERPPVVRAAEGPLTSLFQEALSPELALDLSNLEDILKACLCLPHVFPLKREAFVPQLRGLLHSALGRLGVEWRNPRDESSPPSRKKKRPDPPAAPLAPGALQQKVSLLVGIIVETLHHVLSPPEFLEVLAHGAPFLSALECPPLRENIHFLKAVDIILASLADQGALEEHLEGGAEGIFRRLYPLLSPSLASYKPLVRSLVAHILLLLEQPNRRKQSPFALMVRVESSPLSPLAYKERLRLLHFLNADLLLLGDAAPTGDLAAAPLFFFIGQLFVNFKMLWDPVIQELAHYALALPETLFWPLWSSNLESASHLAMKKLCGKDALEEDSVEFSDSTLDTLYSGLASHPSYASLNAQPDFLNFRALLWRAMGLFPELCERHNSDLIALFFDFLTKELFPVDFDVAPTQNISLEATDQEDDQRDEASSSAGDSQPMEARDRVQTVPTSALCEHLSLFAKFSNPQAAHRSPELEEMYREFLSHPNAKVQQLALDCVLTYKHHYLTPYVESLHNIVNDKKFKAEFTFLDIEGKGETEQTGKSIKDEHRAEFMTVLMRILFGKLIGKLGAKSGHSSKSRSTAFRKNIVIRFLAGANESELDTFFDLAFAVLLRPLEGDPLEVVERALRETDPACVVPLKRLKGLLGTLEALFKSLGSLLVQRRTFLLKTLLYQLAVLKVLETRRSEVSPRFIHSIKQLRKVALQGVVSFFSHYGNYRWSRRELEAMYRVAVWPGFTQLSQKGSEFPSSILRLFLCWGQTRQYHPLLSRHHPEDVSLTPLPVLIELTNHPNCSASVVASVYDLINQLLSEDAEDDLDRNAPYPFDLPLEDALPLESKMLELGLDKLTYGQSLAAFFMDVILVRLKGELTVLNQGQVINPVFLDILIHLAPWVRKSSDAKELLDSVVPALKNNCVKQTDQASYLLDTVGTLLPTLEDKGANYSRHLLSMFSVMNEVKSRASLSRVVAALYPPSDQGAQVGEWCVELNALSEAVTEEIDVERRLRCTRKINVYLKTTDTFEEDVALFLFHQQVWFLCQGEDQALCDLAILCLQNLFELVVRLQAQAVTGMEQLLEIHLIPLLQFGFKNPKDTIRANIMKVLGLAVRKCSDFHPKLKDLFSLANLNEPDVDFFENIAHIQMGRRAKALIHLTRGLAEGKLHFRRDTLLFLVQIPTGFLFKAEYANDHNLMDMCVLCVAAIARQLPWYHYVAILRRYLNLVPRELKQLKLGVNLIDAILNAFHEDLSCLEGISLQHLPKMQEEEEEDEEEEEESSKEDSATPQNDAGEEGTTEIVNTSEEAPLANALSVYRTIALSILPQIWKTFGKRSKRDTEHKINKKKYAEEEDIKKIPLALALVKLLKKMPKELLDLNVPSILGKLVEFLKSRLESIRREARNMLVKVMVELGGDYLPILVNDMHKTMTKGYQAHVMIYTLHSILIGGIRDSLQPSQVGPCLSEIVQISLMDVFGAQAAEEVTRLISKTFEAKAHKGYPILGMISNVIAVDHLQTMILPLKQKLRTQDKTQVGKVSRCLHNILVGLVKNPNISVAQKSIFVFGIISNKIKELAVNTQSKGDLANQPQPTRPDCFLLEPEPRRVGHAPKTSFKTTSHALVEFALNLLFYLIRYKELVPTNTEHCALLDAYVPIMSDCLLSEYPDVSMCALRLIRVMLKYNLPSFKTNLSSIVQQMFTILQKFAATTLTKGKLFQLVQMDFRTLAAIIIKVPYFKLAPEYSKILIIYVRTNLEEPNRCHASFTILKAIIKDRIQMPELHHLMQELQALSITMPNPTILDQMRNTLILYLLNYPKRKSQYIHILVFYLKNVAYSVPQGRMAATMMLRDLMAKLADKFINRKVEATMWFRLSQQFVKEEVKEHRTLIFKLLQSLFLQSKFKNALLSNCLKLLRDDLLKSRAENALVLNMAAQGLLAMLEVPVSDLPQQVLTTLVPRVAEVLHPSRYQPEADLDDEATQHEVVCFDVALSSLLDLFLKLARLFCCKEDLSKWNKAVKDDVWVHIKDHLLYPNLKVRRTASVILGHLFGQYPVQEGGPAPPIAASEEATLELVQDLCEQLKTECPIESPYLSELGMASIRNLVFLIRQASRVPLGRRIWSQNSTSSSSPPPPDQENGDRPVARAALTVLSKVGALAYKELRQTRMQKILVRKCFLNLIAGVVVVLGPSLGDATKVVARIMSHLTRELSVKNIPASLTAHTQQVADLVRESIGVERYSEEVVRFQANLKEKRTNRKARMKELVVRNTHLAMKRKAKKKEANKILRKRKSLELNLRPNKKRCLKYLAMM